MSLSEGGEAAASGEREGWERTSLSPSEGGEAAASGEREGWEEIRDEARADLDAGEADGRPRRRGWREVIEPGLYRAHRISCPASATREPGLRCDCPYQAHLPSDVPGRTSPQNLEATTIADARVEKARRQLEGRLLAGQERERRRAGKVTLSDFFWDAFLPKQQLRPATKRNYARVFRTHCEPLIGDRPLSSLSEEDMAELISQLERRAAERRELTGKRNSAWVAQQLIPLQSALSAAVRWRRIPSSPLQRPMLPEVAPKRKGEVDVRDDPKRILSKDQIDELCEAARQTQGTEKHMGERDHSLMRTAYELALRNSEARGLRWPDVDFKRGIVSVDRQIDPVTSGEAQTKGKRARHLPASEAAFECLELWHWLRMRKEGADPGDYVWHGRDPEAPMPIGMPNRRVVSAQEAAGLTDEEGHALIIFHGLRHSRASHLLLDGVPMLEVSRFLGHSSQLITASAYSHLVPDDEFSSIRGLMDGGSRKRKRRRAKTGAGRKPGKAAAERGADAADAAPGSQGEERAGRAAAGEQTEAPPPRRDAAEPD